ncbi:hypothetical protein [Candidatus Enterococcus clewellii]|uniref:Uncharacterized protein n=1 Tax=Candidatus Enterococcus clewellii TaxID=1834193 RepID=A0A242KCY6_9ENTE|nr:hypothetical protein [Enterococcus sp. 9E7_DIV0242]OTP19034.1 hypothetical protein A5888_000848 [Enterococcus sp. 9E7_DIV0242]
MEKTNKEITNEEVARIKLPRGIRLVSLWWALDGIITIIALGGAIFDGIQYGSVSIIGALFLLFTIIIKFSGESCLLKETPAMYQRLKVVYGLNILQFILQLAIFGIPATLAKTAISAAGLLWFGVSLPKTETKQYFHLFDKEVYPVQTETTD